jgi:hypothetical protein
MLPADVTGVLGITYEFDASRKHCLTRNFEIVDSECDHRACGEEAMKFIGRTIKLQDRAICELEPDLVVGLPVDGQAKDVSEQRDSFIQMISADSDETDLQHRHGLLLAGCGRCAASVSGPLSRGLYGNP